MPNPFDRAGLSPRPLVPPQGMDPATQARLPGQRPGGLSGYAPTPADMSVAKGGVAQPSAGGGGFLKNLVTALPMLLGGPGAFGAALTSLQARDQARPGSSPMGQIMYEAMQSDDPIRTFWNDPRVNELASAPDGMAQIEDAMAVFKAAGREPTTDIQNAMFMANNDPEAARQIMLGQAQGQETQFDKEIRMYQDVLGLSPQEALMRATDQYTVGQWTDMSTGQTIPILINKMTGAGQPTGGGPTIPPEHIAVGRQSGLLTEERELRDVQAGASAGAAPVAGGDPAMNVAPAAPTAAEAANDALAPTEQMTAAQASALGTGFSAGVGRTVGAALAAFGIEGAQDQTLLDAQATLADLRLGLSAYIRDEAGTARLAGIREFSAAEELFPNMDWATSPQENITKLIRLRERIMDDLKRYHDALNQPRATKEYVAIRAQIDTAYKILDKIGSREELAAGLEYSKRNPTDWSRVGHMLGAARAGAPRAVAKASQALPEEPGAPPEKFEPLMERARTGGTFTDEDLEGLSDQQIDMLAEAREEFERAQGAQ